MANDIASKASLITFGIQKYGEDGILSSDEEFYEGEEPYFELEEILDYIVSTPATKTYTLTANKNVFWIISRIKFQDNVSTSDSDDVDSDDRYYLDITLEAVSEDEIVPNDYGKEIVITVSSITGYTPKGKFKITVQKSIEGDEWENAEVLTFDASEEGSSDESMIARVGSSSGGCNSGLACGIFAFLLGGIMALRKKR